MKASKFVSYQSKRGMSLITVILITGLIINDPVIAAGQNDSMEVRQEKGQDIMNIVFDRFHINYEMSRLHKMGYYQESVSDSSSLYYLAEGIVEIYIPSNLNQTENAAIYPIKTQKTSYSQIAEDKLLFGNASDMARSSIWRPNSFLNEKNRVNYVFSLAGETKLKGNPVSIVEFEPVDSSHGRVKGRIFIDQEYFGIVKIEYTPLVNHSKVWKEVSWTEEFDFNDGSYELTHVKFLGTTLDDDYHYQAILAMDQLETVSEFPQNLVFMGDDTPLFDQAQEYSDDSFWEGFEHLRHLKPINKLLIADF